MSSCFPTIACPARLVQPPRAAVQCSPARGTAYDSAPFVNLCDDHLKKPANENLRQPPLFYRWAISSWPSSSWVQLRWAIVPLWSETQQIGKGSGPHDGVKGCG